MSFSRTQTPTPVCQRLAEVEEAAAQGDEVRILYIEAAILIKAGWHMMCDEVGQSALCDLLRDEMHAFP